MWGIRINEVYFIGNSYLYLGRIDNASLYKYRVFRPYCVPEISQKNTNLTNCKDLPLVSYKLISFSLFFLSSSQLQTQHP